MDDQKNQQANLPILYLNVHPLSLVDTRWFISLSHPNPPVDETSQSKTNGYDFF